MAPEQAGEDPRLLPDPFGGEPRSRWRELFETRPRSKVARRAERLGAFTVFFLGLHGLWGAAVFAALACLLPWAIDRRKGALRRRERETIVLGR